MTVSHEKLAETLGVTPSCITKVKQRLGIKSKTLSKSNIESIKRYVKENILSHDEKFSEMTERVEDFVPNVRKINETDASSLKAMLQDCKDQYVRNEILIQHLQHELDSQESLMHLNGNRTLSVAPHLKPLESFQKVNIQLRNQIIQLEAELGRSPQTENEDPFE